MNLGFSFQSPSVWAGAKPKRHLVAGTHTAGTVPGKFRREPGVNQPSMSLPGGLGSFLHSSAAYSHPDSGCSDRGRNLCPISALDSGESNRKIQFRVKFCCKKAPAASARGRTGDTVRQTSPGRLFSPSLNPLNAPAEESQCKPDAGTSAPGGLGRPVGASGAQLTVSCLSSRQTGLSFRHHMAGSGLLFWIWIEFVAFCPRRSKPN